MKSEDVVVRVAGFDRLYVDACVILHCESSDSFKRFVGGYGLDRHFCSKFYDHVRGWFNVINQDERFCSIRPISFEIRNQRRKIERAILNYDNKKVSLLLRSLDSMSQTEEVLMEREPVIDEDVRDYYFNQINHSKKDRIDDLLASTALADADEGRIVGLVTRDKGLIGRAVPFQHKVGIVAPYKCAMVRVEQMSKSRRYFYRLLNNAVYGR